MAEENDVTSKQNQDSNHTLKVKKLDVSDYADKSGYETNFLNKQVPLPNFPNNLKSDRVHLYDSSGYELKYTHFSVVMSKSRRLAFFTAVNIDGNQTESIKRDDDVWYYDPRIKEEFQSGEELYIENPLDRGHLVRRLDPVWGVDAEEANEDTFHFTNCAPQHKSLNRKTWLDLETYILENADNRDLKINVFTGPVFRADDMMYREKFQIPVEYWKVVTMIKRNGEMSATAYLQTQKNLLVNLKFAFGEYKTYQVPITRIEALTQLSFGNLSQSDPLAGVKTVIGYEIQGPNDVKL